MPALNFTVFMDKILSGDKTQTIRLERKHPIKPDDKLYIYTRMRYKECLKLGEAVCSKVVPIWLERVDWDHAEIIAHTEARNLTTSDLVDVAVADGFCSISDFYRFFIDTYKLKKGEVRKFDIIKWRDFIPA